MRRECFLSGGLLALPALAAAPAEAPPRLRAHVLIANKPACHPDFLDPNLVNAWGLAIRLYFAAGPDEVDGLFGCVELEPAASR